MELELPIGGIFLNAIGCTLQAGDKKSFHILLPVKTKATAPVLWNKAHTGFNRVNDREMLIEELCVIRFA